uniref:CddX n=1 Tax=Rhodococcus ruber TaxID=1830 RepID=Q938F4_9NOCA|nr:cddX [Rhodococcus ruber]
MGIEGGQHRVGTAVLAQSAQDFPQFSAVRDLMTGMWSDGFLVERSELDSHHVIARREFDPELLGLGVSAATAEKRSCHEVHGATLTVGDGFALCLVGRGDRTEDLLLQGQQLAPDITECVRVVVLGRVRAGIPQDGHAVLPVAQHQGEGNPFDRSVCGDLLHHS